MRVKMSEVGPIDQFLIPRSAAEAARMLAPDLERWKQEGIGFGEGKNNLLMPDQFNKAVSADPAAQTDYAQRALAPLRNVNGEPAQKFLGEMLSAAKTPGLGKYFTHGPTMLAYHVASRLKTPLSGPGTDEQQAQMIGVGKGSKPGEIKVTAGAPETVEAQQLGVLNNASGVRHLARLAIAATVAAGGLATIDAVRKYKKAKKLERDLEDGANVKSAADPAAKGFIEQVTELPDKAIGKLRDAATGLPRGGVLSALPGGAMVPLAGAALWLGMNAGYKPIDSLTDSARSRWIREKKLRARKEFHDAMAGISKEGQFLDRVAEGLLDEMEKSAEGLLQDLVSGVSGSALSVAAMLAGGGAMAGKALADSRDKQKKRLAALEQEIMSRSLPNHPVVSLASGPTDMVRRLSAGEVVIPEVMPSRKKRDEGGELKLAAEGDPANPPGTMLSRGFGAIGAALGGAVASGQKLGGGIREWGANVKKFGDPAAQQQMIETALMKPENTQKIVDGVYNKGMESLKGGIGNMAQGALSWLQNLPQHLKNMKATWLRDWFQKLTAGGAAPKATPAPLQIGPIPQNGSVPDGSPVAKGATTPQGPRVPGPATRGAASANGMPNAPVAPAAAFRPPTPANGFQVPQPAGFTLPALPSTNLDPYFTQQTQ